jgi:hypothetical protein
MPGTPASGQVTAESTEPDRSPEGTPRFGSGSRLTLRDLRAIGHASRLAFHHNTPRHPGGERANWLECGQDAENSPNGYEQFHTVALEPTAITIYDGRADAAGARRASPLSGVAPGDATGCVRVFPRHSSAHQTWIRALRPGDRIAVCFLIGNNNSCLQDAGLSRDDAWLIVRRQGASRDARYYLCSQISPTFYHCRMIEPIVAPEASAGG